jgi:hypothetical protein
MTQGSDQAPSSKESPRPLTTYSKQRATEFRPELADHHHSSIEAASMSRRCPVSSAQCSPKERGTKRKALGIDGRSARFLCAVSILLHRDSPFCEAVQVATHDWIVAAKDARAHYMFLLGGDRRPLLGMWVTALRWSTSPNTATQLGLRRDNTRGRRTCRCHLAAKTQRVPSTVSASTARPTALLGAAVVDLRIVVVDDDRWLAWSRLSHGAPNDVVRL